LPAFRTLATFDQIVNVALWQGILVRLSLALLLICTAAGAATIVVDDNHPFASDANAGTVTEPLKTVQAALDRVASGDTVSIKPGLYEMAGYTRTFEFPIALVGEDADTTILQNGGKLRFSAPLVVKHLGFADFDSEIFELVTAGEQTLDGVVLENCLFRRVQTVLDNSTVSQGTLRNVIVRNCRFSDISDSKVNCVRLSSGTVENVSIYRNTFQNMASDTRQCIAVFIGSNETRDRTRNVYVVGNEFNDITGPTNVVDGVGCEVHAVLCYGSNIQVLANLIQGVNRGDDHEAIYLKSSHSVIADNTVRDCGSGAGGADITLKGEDLNEGNLVQANRINGDLGGRGLMVHGSATIRHNHIAKPSGERGIDAYAFSKSVEISSNYVEVGQKSALELADAAGGSIVTNCLICYTGTIVRVVNCTNVTVEGNIESTVSLACPWTNEAPRIDSGIIPSNTIADVPTKELSVTASDPDAGPRPLRYTWSRPTGPARVVFRPNDSVEASSTTATFCAPGVYTVQVEVFDGVNMAVQQVLLHVDPADLDTDGDLIDDAWEVEHGLDPLDKDDADGDEDRDGISNLDEFVTGTSATNSNPPFAVQGMETASAGLCLLVPSVSGRVYDVDCWDYSQDVNVWIPLTNDIPGTGEMLRIVTPFDLEKGFYQVRVRVP